MDQRTHRLRLLVPLLLVALLMSGCLSSGQSSVLRELNADRRAHGVGSLPDHAVLDKKAQAWAAKLAREGRLAHSTLTAGVPSCWQGLGENVGRGASAASVQDAFMRSSGHRANVLNPRWDHVGVGYAKAGATVYVVQVFLRGC